MWSFVNRTKTRFCGTLRGYASDDCTHSPGGVGTAAGFDVEINGDPLASPGAARVCFYLLLQHTQTKGGGGGHVLVSSDYNTFTRLWAMSVRGRVFLHGAWSFALFILALV